MIPKTAYRGRGPHLKSLEAREQKVARRLVDAVFHSSRFLVLSNLVFAGVLAVRAWSLVPVSWLTAWLAALAVSVGFRFFLSGAYWRAPHSKSPRQWICIFTAGSTSTALIWGSFIFFLSFSDNSDLKMATLVALISVTAGFAIINSSQTIAVRLFMAGILIPVITYIAFSEQGGTFTIALSLLLALFMDRISTSERRAARDFFRLQEKNRELKTEHEAVRGEAKAYKKRLSASDELLMDALDASPDAIAFFDSHFRLVAFNKKFQDYYFPFDEGSLKIGRDYDRIISDYIRRTSPHTPEEVIDSVIQRRLTALEKGNNSIELQLDNGQWVLINELRTEAGNLISLSVDITELKRREKELSEARDEAESANKAKSAFLATMSHEIRTPMNGILGMTSLLLDSDLDEKQRDWAESVKLSGDALLHIINDILDYSKLDARKVELEERPVHLLDMARNVLDLMSFEARKKGLFLALVVDPALPETIFGDQVRLKQVLMNLLGNAIKFTEQGCVCLRLLRHMEEGGQARLRLEVEDTGIGIDSAAREHLFEEFTQADGSTTRRYGGTGLGLAICRQIADLMDREIGVESTPGEGSLFWFELALRAESAAPCRPGKGQAKRPLAIIGEDGLARRAAMQQAAYSGYEPFAIDDGEVLAKKTPEPRCKDADILVLSVDREETADRALATFIPEAALKDHDGPLADILSHRDGSVMVTAFAFADREEAQDPDPDLTA